LRRLNENDVRYVLIGGLAMMLHGSAHITEDIDIGYARSAANFAALAGALRSMNARLRNVPRDLPFVLDARTFVNTQNLTLETDLAPFDLLGYIPGVDDFDQLFERAILTQLDGIAVRIASLDDIIAMKRAADRPKDRNHIAELLELKQLSSESAPNNTIDEDNV
jgi:predicted nucleotidyltransferase